VNGYSGCKYPLRACTVHWLCSKSRWFLQS